MIAPYIIWIYFYSFLSYSQQMAVIFLYLVVFSCIRVVFKSGVIQIFDDSKPAEL